MKGAGCLDISTLALPKGAAAWDGLWWFLDSYAKWDDQPEAAVNWAMLGTGDCQRGDLNRQKIQSLDDVAQRREFGCESDDGPWIEKLAPWLGAETWNVLGLCTWFSGGLSIPIVISWQEALIDIFWYVGDNYCALSCRILFIGFQFCCS